MLKVVDLRGQECPTPVIRVLREFMALGEGGEIVALIDSEPCVEQIKAFLGHLPDAEVDAIRESGYYRLRVRRLRRFEWHKPRTPI